MNKNEITLKKFTSYCEAHPEERFFQALRNFVQLNLNPDVGFIFFAGGEYNHKIWDEEYEEAAKLIYDSWNIEDVK